MAAFITGFFNILGKTIQNKSPETKPEPKDDRAKRKWVSNRELVSYAIFSLFMLCLTFYGLSTTYGEEISSSKDVFSMATYAISIPFFFSFLALTLSLLYYSNKKPYGRHTHQAPARSKEDS